MEDCWSRPRPWTMITRHYPSVMGHRLSLDMPEFRLYEAVEPLSCLYGSKKDSLDSRRWGRQLGAPSILKFVVLQTTKGSTACHPSKFSSRRTFSLQFELFTKHNKYYDTPLVNHVSLTMTGRRSGWGEQPVSTAIPTTWTQSLNI